MLPEVAVIVAVPAAMAAMTPAGLTVVTVAADDDQVMEPVGNAAPVWSLPVAVAVTDCPGASVADASVTVTEVRTGTTTTGAGAVVDWSVAQANAAAAVSAIAMLCTAERCTNDTK
jgi:hypothetical protein